MIRNQCVSLRHVRAVHANPMNAMLDRSPAKLLHGGPRGGGLDEREIGQRSQVACLWRKQHYLGGKSSATSERSSFNSFTVASIFERLNSFTGRPSTISSFCPLLRIGNDEINPFSTP